MLDFVKVLFRDLIEEHSKAADLVSELVLGITLWPYKLGSLIQFHLAFLVRQHEKGHIVGTGLAPIFERHHELY